MGPNVAFAAENLTIQAANPDLNGNGVTGDDVVGDIAAGDFAGFDSIITSGQLGTILNSANVSLASVNDITVNAPVSWNSAFGLTLAAGNKIITNSDLSSLGSGGAVFNAPTISLGANVTTGGSQTYNGAVTLTGDSTLTGTNLTLASGLIGGGNDLTLDFSTPFTLIGGISGVDNFTAQKAVNVNGAFSTSGSQTYNGAVTLTGDSNLVSGGPLSFSSTVNGAFVLTSTAASTSFNGAILDVATTLNSTGTTTLNSGSSIGGTLGGGG